MASVVLSIFRRFKPDRRCVNPVTHRQPAPGSQPEEASGELSEETGSWPAQPDLSPSEGSRTPGTCSDTWWKMIRKRKTDQVVNYGNKTMVPRDSHSSGNFFFGYSSPKDTSH